MADKLIIFDYSGTLSLEMAAFARSDNLMQHLKESGLFVLGVDSAALFWDIVNATWTKGSTTGRGYKKVMRERIRESFPEIAESRQPELSGTVSNFVDAYLEHSRIDEHWRPVFEIISSDKSVQVIIATDHYAEATDAIIGHLAQWGIQATRLAGNSPGNIVIANSADLGVPKANRRFWEIVKNDLQSDYSRILLIDDFGQNEQVDDNYSQAGKIDVRRKSTIDMLHNVFNADVELFSFIAGDKQQDDLITRVAAVIGGFLSF